MNDETAPPPLYTDLLGKVADKRRGFTTGTAAQAAAKAAAFYFFTGEKPENISVTLPKGRKNVSGKEMSIPLAFYSVENEWHHAGVVKDPGDDDDITGGALIAARVRSISSARYFADDEEHCWKTEAAEGLRVKLSGGKGIGRVTGKGLSVPPGKPAINPVPKRMIFSALKEVWNEAGKETEGILSQESPLHLDVEIYVPQGAELAKRTWNPRLGVEGGISIIGTSGVVEPKSSKAYTASIAAFIRAAKKQGHDAIIITPGYVGEKYLMDNQGISERNVATVGDHIGWALLEANRLRFRRVVLVGHIGKLVKIAAGIFNTHWSAGDARLETIAAWAAHEGAEAELVRKILGLKLAEESVLLLENAGLTSVFTRICEKCILRIEQRIRKEQREQEAKIECVLLDLQGRPLSAVPDSLLEDETWQSFR